LFTSDLGKFHYLMDDYTCEMGSLISTEQVVIILLDTSSYPDKLLLLRD